jgi:hypothetical protein
MKAHPMPLAGNLADLAGQMLLILCAPVFLFYRLLRSGLFRRHHDGIIYSLSPDVFTINDHTGIASQADRLRWYGIFGKHWHDLSTSFGLAHPPLGKLLQLVGNIRGFFLISLSLYAAAFVISAYLADRPLFLLWLPYIFLSPYFKNNAIVTGRFDFPAWPFLLVSLSLWYHGFFMESLPLVVFASLIHPSALIATGLFLLAYLVHVPEDFPVILVYACLLSLSISFWAIPFYRARKYTGVHAHSWNFKDLKDDTRIFSVTQKKMIALVPFVGASFMVCSPYLFSLSLVPLVLLGFLHFKETLINRFSLEMLIIIVGGFVSMEAHSVGLTLFYLFSIYFYASPSKRFDFPVRVMSLKRKQIESLKDVYKNLPKICRILYVPYITDADDMRRFAQYSHIPSGTYCKEEHQEFITGACYAPGLMTQQRNGYFFSIDGTSKPHLEGELSRYGIGYLLTFSGPFKDLLDRYGFHEIHHLSFSGIGSVPGIDYYLYECPRRASILEPEEKLVYAPNALSFQANAPGWYHLKYRYCPAWRAYDENRRLPIQYNQYGMFVEVKEPGRMTFRYRHSYCWELKYRAEYTAITSMRCQRNTI